MHFGSNVLGGTRTAEALARLANARAGPPGDAFDAYEDGERERIYKGVESYSALQRRNSTEPIIAAHAEPMRIPSLDMVSIRSSVKARPATNNDMVEPMPPSQPAPCSSVQLTPFGSDANPAGRRPTTPA